MPRIFGIITERLLREHGEDSPGWKPPRVQKGASAEAKRNAEGHKVGKGPGRTKG